MVGFSPGASESSVVGDRGWEGAIGRMPEALYSIMGIFSKSNFKVPAGHKTAFLFSPPQTVLVL